MCGAFGWASTYFEHHVLIIRRSKLRYTASGIITPIGGRLVHGLREDRDKYTEMHGQQNLKMCVCCYLCTETQFYTLLIQLAIVCVPKCVI